MESLSHARLWRHPHAGGDRRTILELVLCLGASSSVNATPTDDTKNIAIEETDDAIGNHHDDGIDKITIASVNISATGTAAAEGTGGTSRSGGAGVSCNRNGYYYTLTMSLLTLLREGGVGS